jgi:hypothetical protein
LLVAGSFLTAIDRGGIKRGTEACNNRLVEFSVLVSSQACHQRANAMHDRIHTRDTPAPHARISTYRQLMKLNIQAREVDMQYKRLQKQTHSRVSLIMWIPMCIPVGEVG